MNRDVVLVGASAGGVEAIRTLVSGLPPDFPATVLVVLHVSRGSVLPAILDRAGPLPARHAVHGEALTGNAILVAPPDHHLLVHDHAVSLSRGPRENGHRPAVDVLFRSAARALGSRVVAVVMSGALDDGAAGALAVLQRGGRLVVQDPEQAVQPSMPLAAMRVTGTADGVAVEKMAALLTELVTEELPDVSTAEAEPAGSPDDDAGPDLMHAETALAAMDLDALTAEPPPGSPSGFACPDCHGGLFEIVERGMVRYRCRVGHAWSGESLIAEMSSELEGALWMALRSLEERAALSHALALRAGAGGHRITSQTFDDMSQETSRAAAVLRDLINGLGPEAGPE